MSDEIMFYGVDRGWMQAQWRDCADKGTQLGIFRDMVGKKVTVQEILDAVGEPEYCGPTNTAKRAYRPYTPEEDERIAAMAAEGRTDAEIAEELGRKTFSISARIKTLCGKGMEIRRGAKKPAPVPAEKPEKMPVPVPVEDLTGYAFGGLRQAEAELAAMMKEEKDLEARLAEVTAKIGAFRKSLSELLAMAEGGAK